MLLPAECVASPPRRQPLSLTQKLTLGPLVLSFDPVTVTRYSRGEYQAQHLDSRLPHQINRDQAYLASGGQRIAQVICYLQAPQAGGETRFFDPAFDGLAVTPTQGTALVFPTA
jgi:prolyl 4-hydroxylase